MTKIIANYLPQYHETEENNLWWGKGYTDWVAVKKSVPLYKNHVQPRVPLDEHYYDLSRKDEIVWQCKLAKKAGIYGFGIYHYWFSPEQILLTKPAEIIRDNPDIDIHYCFLWDNCSWKRTWSNVDGNDWAPLYDPDNETTSEKYLAELVYGGRKEWQKHFEYLLPFFQDSRYITSGNKPLFGFMVPENDTEILKEMCLYWDELARQHGLGGIAFMNRLAKDPYNFCPESYIYQPQWSAGWTGISRMERAVFRIKKSFFGLFKKPLIEDYDAIWKKILADAKKRKGDHVYLSAFVGFDDTPRRGVKGRVIKGTSPAKFQKYFEELYKLCDAYHKEFLFVTAWNEWAEGAVLEPDVLYGNKFLAVIKEITGKYST